MIELFSQIRTRVLSSILLLGFSAVALAQNTPGYNNKIPDAILTPDTVETRIGTLKFFDGSPTKDTVQLVYDNLDFIRGVETFLNGMPATSIEGLRLGHPRVRGRIGFKQCPEKAGSLCSAYTDLWTPGSTRNGSLEKLN